MKEKNQNAKSPAGARAIGRSASGRFQGDTIRRHPYSRITHGSAKKTKNMPAVRLAESSAAAMAARMYLWARRKYIAEVRRRRNTLSVRTAENTKLSGTKQSRRIVRIAISEEKPRRRTYRNTNVSAAKKAKFDTKTPAVTARSPETNETARTVSGYKGKCA